MHCGVQTGCWCNCVWLHCPPFFAIINANAVICPVCWFRCYVTLLITKKGEIFTSLVLCHIAHHQEGGDFHFVGAMSSCLSPRRGRFSEGFLLGFRERFSSINDDPKFWELPQCCRRGRCCHFGILHCSTVVIFTDPTHFQGWVCCFHVTEYGFTAPFRGNFPRS
jgi:hypothetical protein